MHAQTPGKKAVDQTRVAALPSSEPCSAGTKVKGMVLGSERVARWWQGNVETDSVVSGEAGGGEDDASSDAVSLSCDEAGSSTRAFEALSAAYPSAPAAELRRFADAYETEEDCLAVYARHVDWRSGEGSPASLEALAAPARLGGRELFTTVGGVTRRGDVVVVVEGARYDVELPPEHYVALLCQRMDEHLSRSTCQRMTVLIDCRPGLDEGWLNPPATSFLPFIRAVAALVPEQYPERLRHVVVYPLPSWAAFIMNMVRAMVNDVTRNKIVLLAGEDKARAPCPAGLADYVALEDLPAHCRERHAALAPSAATPA